MEDIQQVNPSFFFDGPISHDSKSNSEVEFDTPPAQYPPHLSERALLRRVDLKVLPILVVIYLMAFLDRVNISNALTLGLQTDLGLKGNEPNAALTIFFVPYIIFEIPSNILLKRLKPHVWLSGCMFLFGLVMTLQGFVQNYSGLLATRFFLGLAEAGIFPGCFYLISMWYKRGEAQRRFTVFFSSTTLAAAFGGLLASAIQKMNGMRGYSGWRWIFILEGTLTCVLAVAAYFLVADFPEEVKWLTEEERAFIKARLRADQGDSAMSSRITLRDVLLCFKDYKVFLGGLMYFGIIIPAYGFAYFTPTIIKTYGYGPISTQLHAVPPIAAAFVFSLLIAYLSDKSRHRFLFVLLPLLLAIAGVGILLNIHDNFSAQYAALFLVAMGTYSAMPVIICWYTMNLLGGHVQRSVGTAWMIGFGNIGGIIATFSFLARDAPFYKRGYGIVLGGLSLAVVSSVVYLIAIWRQNKISTHMGNNEDAGSLETRGKRGSEVENRYLL